ncbi:MAG: hypothetical protein NVSMB3_00050 [Acidobacteriaceae bacterium]
MSRSRSENSNLPILPAFNVGLLALGAAVHHSPTLLSPMLGWFHSLAVAVIR